VGEVVLYCVLAGNVGVHDVEVARLGRHSAVGLVVLFAKALCYIIHVIDELLLDIRCIGLLS